MKPALHPPRNPSTLSNSLDHKLHRYTLAATAAGVALLAVQPSQAKIVYRQTHKVIGTNGFYGLDLNRDGIVDFIIQESGAPFSSSGSNRLGVKEAYGNGVRGGNHLASALSQGAPIGPRQQFLATSNPSGEIMFEAGCSADGGCGTYGKWGGPGARYLGLKFKISGEVHYGWARLNVVIQPGHNIVATLTGYAYETIPNKKILAGKTSQVAGAIDTDSSGSGMSESSPITQPSRFQRRTLGRLALGSQRINPRRQP